MPRPGPRRRNRSGRRPPTGSPPRSQETRHPPPDSFIPMPDPPSPRDIRRTDEFDLLVKDFQGALILTACEVVAQRTHDLDVLLRHRLLPQPGGFEGPSSDSFESIRLWN